MARNDNRNSPPDTRVVLKPKQGEGTITLASFWTDGERPSGGLDRRITRLKVEWKDRDGNLHTAVVDNTDKASATHYCNLYQGPPPGGGGGGGGGGNGRRNNAPADDFDPDALPF